MDSKIRNSFENISPTESQSIRMWNNIVSEQNKKKTLSFRPARKLATTLAMLAVIIFSVGTITNAMTGGKVMETIKEVLGIEQTEQTVMGQAVKLAERGIEVWAPEIYGMSDTHIVFGTQRGLIVYDRTRQGISATIDTQAVGCIYFDSQPKNTNVLVDDNNIIVYNTENSQPYGECYIYNINEDGDLEPIIESEAKAYHEKWQAHQSNYTDVFDKYHETDVFKQFNEKMGDMYGRRAINYDDSYNFLVISGEKYLLYSEEHDVFTKTELPMIMLYETETAEAETLPAFVYTGEDKAIAAICEYFADDALRHAEHGELWIPGFEIYHKAEKSGELLVFGNFSSHGYKKNGNMMEVASGGGMAACFHLEKSADGYEVKSADVARDGSFHAKDIKEFTKGYFGLYQKYMNGGENRRECMKEYMAMYVRNNNLDVKYIKEYGWNPYGIFG